MPFRRTLAIGLIAALLIAVVPASAASGDQIAHITNLTIEPGGPNLNLTVHYSTSFMTKLFSLLFGARIVQPSITDQLSPLGDVKMISIDTSGQVARLVAYNESWVSGGMYVYDKGATFPADIDVINIQGSNVVTPVTINNSDTLPTFFYR